MTERKTEIYFKMLREMRDVVFSTVETVHPAPVSST